MRLQVKRGLLVMVAAALALSGVVATQRALAGAPAAPTDAPPPEVCTWRDCKIGAISYSQDDAANINPSTNSCKNQLENAGLRGTFYHDGTTSPVWLATLSNAGHEVGSHLASHDLNCAMPPSCAPNCTLTTLLQITYTITQVNTFRQNQIDPNVAAIESRTGKPVVSMAYPCGNADPGRMKASESYFVGARSYYDQYGSRMRWIYDVNQPTPVPSPFMLLNADTYFSMTLVNQALYNGSWEIVTAHDYCPGIPTLQSISNTVWIAPVGDVLKYIAVRSTTQISNYVRSGYYISFDAVHTLGTFQRQRLNETPLLPIVYDNPVTIRTPITTTTNVVNVRLNGSPVSYTVGTISGTKYVWFNTPLTATQHVSIQLDAPTAVRLLQVRTTGVAPDTTLPLLAMGGLATGLFVLHKLRRRA
jgi:hypothetical protein